MIFIETHGCGSEKGDYQRAKQRRTYVREGRQLQ